jgi:hypothetical protein
MTTSDKQSKNGDTGTYLSHTHDDTSGGRFRAIGTPSVTGTTPIPQYPQAGAPFQRDPVPDEPPLGYRIDAINPHDPEPSPECPVQATDDPAHAPSSGSLVQQPSGGLVSERAGSSSSSNEGSD